MANEKKYADGVRFFERKDNQPDFVLGSLIITPAVLQKWAADNKEFTSDYNGMQQVKFQFKMSRAGKAYLELHTYKHGNNNQNIGAKDDLLF